MDDLNAPERKPVCHFCERTRRHESLVPDSLRPKRLVCKDATDCIEFTRQEDQRLLAGR